MFTSVYSVIQWKRFFNYDASIESVTYFLDYDAAKQFAEKKANELFAGQYINYHHKRDLDGSFSDTWYGSDDWYEKAVELNDFAWATHPRDGFVWDKTKIEFHDFRGQPEIFDNQELFDGFIKKSQSA